MATRQGGKRSPPIAMTLAAAALPETMLVLGQWRYGGVEVLEELRLPVP
jgi:hypothetical protein